MQAYIATTVTNIINGKSLAQPLDHLPARGRPRTPALAQRRLPPLMAKTHTHRRRRHLIREAGGGTGP